MYKRDALVKARFNINSNLMVKVTRSTVDMKEEKVEFRMKQRMEYLRFGEI